MTASITTLAPQQAQPSGLSKQPQVTRVNKVDPQGRVLSVDGEGQQHEVSAIPAVSITAQANHITPAKVGDAVLVQNTNQGCVVIALLAAPNDSPAASITDNNGHIHIKGAKSVTLSTAKGSVEVHENGRIVLDATELSANSERDLTLAGWPIRLN